MQSEESTAEFFQDLFSEFRACLGDFRKILHPFVGPAGIDHGAGIEQHFESGGIIGSRELDQQRHALDQRRRLSGFIVQIADWRITSGTV